MKTATAIDNILTNSFVDTNFKSAIFKTDISDHFLICLFLPSTKVKSESETTFIYKRIVNTFAIEMLKQQLYETNWEEIETNRDPNEAYNILQKVLLLYDHYFPEKEIKVTKKDLKSPWITTGIKKPSKCKQRLYKKFLKNRSSLNESEYKNYKILFDSVKQRAKKLYYSNLITKYKNNIKKTWEVIKDLIGQAKCNKKILPRKIVTENKVVTDTEVIAKHFNTFFTEIGPRLAKKIETPAKTFETYLQKWNTIQPENPLTINELKDAFFFSSNQ